MKGSVKELRKDEKGGQTTAFFYPNFVIDTISLGSSS
jgi:hypothetical protein